MYTGHDPFGPPADVDPLTVERSGEEFVLSLALPFGYILGVPAEILRGGVSVPTALQLMAGQAIWLVVFYFAFHRVWRVGVRQYSAVGA